MRDATSLLWSAVRAAWVSSMHEVMDGTLTWANSTHWTINSFSASVHPRKPLPTPKQLLLPRTRKGHVNTTMTPHVHMKDPIVTSVHIATGKGNSLTTLNTNATQKKVTPARCKK